MARKVIDFTIQNEGRDKGKTFVITEMPASQAESWAMRAILALMANGTDLPENFDKLGMAGMAEVGLKALAGLKWEVAQPLLDEMWTCVEVKMSSTKLSKTRKLVEEDTEEVLTRVLIRAEIWKLHAGFLSAAAL